MDINYLKKSQYNGRFGKHYLDDKNLNYNLYIYKIIKAHHNIVLSIYRIVI